MARRPRDDGKPERHAVRRRQLPGDPLVTQQVGAVGTDVDHQPVVVDRDGLQQRGSGSTIGLKLPDPFAVLAQPQLAGGAEHSLRGLAPELSLLDPKAAGERGADRSEGILASRRHVGRAAHHVAPLGRSVVHQADPEPVGVGMRPHLLDQADEHIAQPGMEGLHGVHRGAQHGQTLGDVLDVQPAAEEVLRASAGKRSWHELLQEPHVPIIQQPDVGNAVAAAS